MIHSLLTGSGDEVLRVLSGEFAPSAAEGRGDYPDFNYLEYDAKTYEGWSKDGREVLIRALGAEFNPPGQPVLADVLRPLISHSHNNQPLAVTQRMNRRYLLVSMLTMVMALISAQYA